MTASSNIRRALVRAPGPDAGAGLTSQSGPPLDLAELQRQHRAYCRALRDLGVDLMHLDPLPGFPDAYFVEDTAVVTPEVAVIARPGAPQRREEARCMAPVLGAHRRLEAIRPPGTLDGGDVMIVGRDAFVGLSSRTNPSGADQLARILTPLGYRCVMVPVADGLHLKSSVNALEDDLLLVAAAWADHPAFDGYRRVPVPLEETYACNTLALNGRLITPAGYPRTLALLAETGRPIVTLETRQLRRMDGGLTCLSIRF